MSVLSFSTNKNTYTCISLKQTGSCSLLRGIGIQ